LFSVVLAAAIAFLVTVLLGSKFIEFLQSRKFGQFVREELPQTHLIKTGTPTMGGIMMLTGLVGALVVVARPNVATLTTLLLVAVVAGIGLLRWGRRLQPGAGRRLRHYLQQRPVCGHLLSGRLGTPTYLRARGQASVQEGRLRGIGLQEPGPVHQGRQHQELSVHEASRVGPGRSCSGPPSCPYAAEGVEQLFSEVALVLVPLHTCLR